jgi:hypothetical protein
MAITYRSSAAGGGTTGTSNRTLAATPAVSDLWVVFVSLSANTNASPTCSDDNGGTYDLVGTALWSTSANNSAVFVRKQLHTNTTSTTITVASGSNSAGEIVVIMCAGSLRIGISAVRSSGSQANGGVVTAPAPALSQAALTANMTLSAVMSGETTTPNASWTERQDASQSNPTTFCEVATRDSGFTSTTITYAATVAAGFASWAIELDGSAPPAFNRKTFSPLGTRVGVRQVRN